MANEAVIIELLGNPRGIPVRFTVDNATGIEKGTLLTITDPRTAVATANDNEAFGGIAAAEKVANDGQTNIAVYTKGIFDLTNDAAATAIVGERISVKGANVFAKVADTDLLFSDIGILLEDAAKSEVAAVLVGSGF